MKLSEKEEKILFHTLGYDYNPDWDTRNGGYRNYFASSGKADDGDYQTCRSLCRKKMMRSNGRQYEHEYFSVTEEGEEYVKNLFEAKKKAAWKRTTRSRRRYQCYCRMSECFASFRDFLLWLSSPDADDYRNEYRI